MDEKLLKRLLPITKEEEEILNSRSINPSFYTDKHNYNFVIDAEKLLKKGKLIEIRPHTRFIHFPKHSHNYVEMVYMCSGETTHIIDSNDVITLKKGELLILNQNATQEILEAGENDIAINFIILPEFLEKCYSMVEDKTIIKDFIISSLSRRSSNISYLHFSLDDILPVENLIENVIWCIFNDNVLTNTITQTTLGLLFMYLSQYANAVANNNSDTYEHRTVFKTLKYIDVHYKDGTLDEIAEILNLKTYTLSRLLKKYTGQNFKELLQERKLQQAVYLLSNTSLTIEEIMNAIGYDNSSYFYRTFKNRYNLTPREYRKNL